MGGSAVEGYYLDFKNFPMSLLQERICNSVLIPSHQILLQDIQERFKCLALNGVRSLDDLFTQGSTTKKLAQLCDACGLPEEYLVILLRHAGVYRPQPNDLQKIPGLDSTAIDILKTYGLKNTRQLWDAARTPVMRQRLSEDTGIALEFLLEAVRLSDLTRAGYVGPIFSRLLYDAGAVSIQTLAGFDPLDLFSRTKEINSDRQYTRAGYQLKDIAWCVDFAQMLPWLLME
jgi:hypothetical protein